MFLRSVVRQLLIWLRFIRQPDLSARIVPTHPAPENIKPGEILVVGDAEYQKWACFRCPGGCGESILLSLNQKQHPCWASNSSNEAQLVKYYDLFITRINEFDNNEKLQLIESIVKLAEQILNMIEESTKINKNYAKPNFDKLIKLLQKSGASEEALNQLKSKSSRQENKKLNGKKKSLIPAFQEIRRRREELGQEFWFYAEEYFSAISSGEWNSHFSSLIALFKELRKIKLSPEQVEKIQTIALKLQVKLDTNAAIIRDELIVEAQEYGKQFQNYLSVKDRQEWNKALDELKPYGSLIIKATGRIMSLYGQWRKAHLIPDNQEIKRKLDYLTTYLSMRKILADWIGNR